MRPILFLLLFFTLPAVVFTQTPALQLQQATKELRDQVVEYDRQITVTKKDDPSAVKEPEEQRDLRDNIGPMITNNIVQTEISIADKRNPEGNAGHITIEIIVCLSQTAPGPVKVSYSTKDGKAIAGTDYIAAHGIISFEKGDLLKKINIDLIGELLCEEDEKFEIQLSDPSGATLSHETATITIENDDCFSTNSNLPNGGRNLKAYEVRFTHTGFTTFFGGPSECPIRANGKVVLYGIVYGAENVPADDDINYLGTLQLDMDIDICSVDGQGDNANLCSMRAIGSGQVNTTLDIYFDARGGYVKIENKSINFLRSITGTCGHEQMVEEKGMIPNKTIATIFNGRDLPMLTNRTLTLGRFVEDDGEGNVTVVEVLRVIKN